MSVHPTAIIEDGAVIGEGVEIGPFCHIGRDVRLADRVVLRSHVVISSQVEIGARTQIDAFTSIGGAPQHVGDAGEGTRVIIGADCTFREHVTVNRGTNGGAGVTVIGDNGYFMTGAHIAHDCQVGANAIFANNATLGGHVEVGEGVFIGGLSAVHQHNRVGDFAFIGGCSLAVADVIPYASAVGNRAILAGLNVIGMKRRGMSRDTILTMRAAYRRLFAPGSETFIEKVEATRASFGDTPEVRRILEFIDRLNSRPLMAPSRGEQ
ncbi:MAG: acyl-ACP--UDP-N-acetylglucosamine O-acyltransferase [Pseudomonadota bacterium]